MVYINRDTMGTTDLSSRTGKLQRLYELAANQAGYFSAVQAHELGYSSRSLVHHVAAGHFERINRGFYRLVGVPAERYEDVVAAWLRLASRGAVVSHETALALYDLAPSRSHEIHLTVPRAHRPRGSQAGSSVRLHTAITPLRRDEVTNRFSVQLTSPARTIADVAESGVDPSVVVEATAHALGKGLLAPSELLEAVNLRSERVRRLVDRAITEARGRA
jgi:predicted transcriptional regulator of viral defense system